MRRLLFATVSLLAVLAVPGAAGCRRDRPPAAHHARDRGFARVEAWRNRLLVVPLSDRDQHGNPVVVRQGARQDPGTGLPYEVWFTAFTSDALPRGGAAATISLSRDIVEFVLVPPGEFTMGSDDAYDGGFVHHVEMGRPYYLAKYPVTQSEWTRVTGSNPSYFKASGPDAPVDDVSWDDCKTAFLEELNAGVDRLLGPEAAGSMSFRLPSEAEWEYACRAGTATVFCSGDTEVDLARVGWYARNSEARTRPVGTREPNAWGVYDMHGNVWEWCEDPWHNGYYGAPEDGSVWVEDGEPSQRVLRGGAWYTMFRGCTSAFRCYIRRMDRHYSVGLRLVLDLASKK